MAAPIPSGSNRPPRRHRNMLIGSGMPLEAAERWCDAWEIEAAGLGLPRDTDYWTAGAEWIAAERAAHRPGW